MQHLTIPPEAKTARHANAQIFDPVAKIAESGTEDSLDVFE